MFPAVHLAERGLLQAWEDGRWWAWCLAMVHGVGCMVYDMGSTVWGMCCMVCAVGSVVQGCPSAAGTSHPHRGRMS